MKTCTTRNDATATAVDADAVAMATVQVMRIEVILLTRERHLMYLDKSLRLSIIYQLQQRCESDIADT